MIDSGKVRTRTRKFLDAESDAVKALAPNERLQFQHVSDFEVLREVNFDVVGFAWAQFGCAGG
eukprot:15483580-Alexandrium_andersonii.AAC.1